MKTKIKSQLLDKPALAETISRIAKQILDKNPDISNMIVIGMRTRGAHIAQRIAEIIFKARGEQSQLGFLDVTFYRDDFRIRMKQPNVQVTDIPFSINEKDIILVDDVLYTGRTIRAALDALTDFGRPSSIQLAVLVDRGHREMPIQPNFTGTIFKTLQKEEIQVRVKEEDSEDGVYLVELIED
ncbi:bifunctional pyr operon transcriptional regulator/uracil phosphoribosyltransferase PyrR [candidate division KSB1 bacterium]